uniref:Uncharacterized protein n=1 Tax=Anguilla anguilla TaxID=7936 RepID=A0A0E9XAI5_ANGAN
MRIYFPVQRSQYLNCLTQKDIHNWSRQPPLTRTHCWITFTSQAHNNVYSLGYYAHITAIIVPFTVF